MPATPALLRQSTLQEFFQSSLNEAITRQSLQADQATVWYLVNLLCQHARAEHCFSEAEPGRRWPALAERYAQALAAPSARERDHELQRLGDLALFVAGLFAESLKRRVVDIDYYVAMGASAYAHLAERVSRDARARAFTCVFQELGQKFVRFVDVLHDVAESTEVHSPRDWLRVYETWVRTQSPRSERLLREHGIFPNPQASLILH